MSNKSPVSLPATVIHSSANRHGLVLYDSMGSPCARRCRITMIEKGLAWDTVEINLSLMEQRHPDYLRINPNGFVPTLAHGTRIIFESNVITEYLDDAFPEIRLYPEEAWEMAEVKMWQSRELAMAKDFRPLMYARLMGPLLRSTRTLEEALEIACRSTSDPADLAWERRVWSLAVLTPAEEAQHEARLLTWLDQLEEALVGRSFLVGDRFTQAEISVYPRVMMYAYVGLSITPERHPNVSRWMGTLQDRPSFVGTVPPNKRKLQRLVRRPLLPWLKRFHQSPEAQRRPLQRLGAAAAGRLLRKGMKVDEVLKARPGASRAIPQPVAGATPPASAMTTRRRGMLKNLDAPLRLHSFRHSPHGNRIERLLGFHGLPFERVEVDMSMMEHKGAGFRAINPLGEVPALTHDARVLIDSLIIAEYVDRLGSSVSGRSLFPDDAEALARVRMWVAFEQGMHKEMRPLFYKRAIRPLLVERNASPEDVDLLLPDGIDRSHREWWLNMLADCIPFDTDPQLAFEAILKKLDVVEAHLARSPFLVGDEPSFADLAWSTRIVFFDEIGLGVAPDRFPALLRWIPVVARLTAARDAQPVRPRLAENQAGTE
jgi:glutathione S-transferase